MHRLRTLHLFAGAGGGILADLLLGHQPVCAVEIDPYCQQVLSARQKDNHLPWFPIFDDVREFDGTKWCGLADIVAGGFPCQDISAAGKGAGIEGERSGMWVEMARIIDEVRPRFAFVENSPMLTSRGLGRVLGDLAEMGYDAEWGVLGARDAGAPHRRDRIWVLAHPQELQRDGGKDNPGKFMGSKPVSEFGDSGREKNVQHSRFVRSRPPEKQIRSRRDGSIHAGWWISEPGVGRVVDGLASGLDRLEREGRLKATGNGQVPQCAAEAFKILRRRLEQ